MVEHPNKHGAIWLPTSQPSRGVLVRPIFSEGFGSNAETSSRTAVRIGKCNMSNFCPADSAGATIAATAQPPDNDCGSRSCPDLPKVLGGA